MRTFRKLIIAAAFMLPCTGVHAEQYLTAGAGWFNFNRSTENSANFDVEYRGNYLFYNLFPVIGGNLNTDGGALGYFGFDYDLQTDALPHWILTPGLAVGAWRNGSSVDLGGTFEFHESVEVDYKFDNQYRAGIQINHTSNAGIYDQNPGANSIMALVSIPLGN